MPANRFAAGQTGDGLVHHSLKDGSGQVFLGGTFIDQGLNIRLGKYTAACGDGIERLIILRIFVETGSICLNERSHLVDKGTGTAGTDAVHTLFHITALKIDDFGILSTQLDGYIGLGSQLLQRGGNGNYLLGKRNLQMIGKGQTAGTGYHWIKGKVSKLSVCFIQEI